MKTETTRKKILEAMQKGIVAYKLATLEWDVGQYYGDGYDLIAEKDQKVAKIELKAIDLQMIATGKRVTQHVTANEIVTATHLVISVFQSNQIENSYVMTMQQFIENSGVRKYQKFGNYSEFLEAYKKLAATNSSQHKGANKGKKKERSDFDINFKPEKIKNWKLYIFKEQWNNI
jgi:hypothetical protein